ncbi:choice-of-anchor I family protein [Cohnella lupini]|nr:choice-of-anchor I family protein [Cohnella lupini]
MSSKKGLSLLLALTVLVSTIFSGSATMAAPVEPGTPYDASGYNVTVPHVIINQVYGGGASTATKTPITNGFIELYNPTTSDIDLSSWSIWYAGRDSEDCTASADSWVQLNLTGTIKAGSYYLITGGKYGDPSTIVLDIDGKGDQSWPSKFFNNKGLKVLLVGNQSPTPPIKNPYEAISSDYVDMVGVACNETNSSIDGYEGATYPTGKDFGQSKQKSVKRISLTDTDNNGVDFKQINYEKATPEFIAANGPHIKASFSFTTSSLPNATIGTPYSTTLAVYGGTTPLHFSSNKLPDGLQLDSVTGTVYGTPASGTEGTKSIAFEVTDSSTPPIKANKTLSLKISPAAIVYNDPLNVTKIGSYSVGITNSEGGVAEIVKYNKENGKFYLVNGSAQPPTLDIVSLKANESMSKDKSVDVEKLSETNGFVYGDLTSVDINTTTERVSVSVQAEDYNTPGKILVLDYDGNLIEEYPAGNQPDMIKSTPDGRYILTADEGEARMGNGNDTVDPVGSITIVDTVNDSISHVKFDDQSVIADDVHIRGASVDKDGQIVSSGTKADAVRDFEPEYITLSGDYKKAFVSLQENNAIATIDIANKTVLSVKSLGLKDLNDPKNSLDLIKNSTPEIHLENVPFKGVYMPDGIATYSVGTKNYILTANEGDATEWPAEDPSRINVTKVSSVKGLLDPNSEAAKFLAGKTAYDKTEVLSDMGNDSIYLLGGRSFSIWDADSLAQVFDSGNDFEEITAERLPDFFNSGHDELGLDLRSAKKGPEPEDVKTGKVGNKTFAFVGLERVGGIMTYDITNPANATFANYINTRILDTEDEDIAMGTDTGPEGIEFIPATDSPTGQPLLLVAFEVSGTVAVYQINATKVALDKTSISTQVGNAPTKITATVTPAGGSAATVTWTSSNNAIATVDSNGNVTPVGAGTATITALSADGLGEAQAVVTVASAPYSGVIGGNTGGTETPKPPVSSGSETVITVETKATADASGKAEATFTDKQITESLEALNKAASEGKTSVLELKAVLTGEAKEAIIHFSADSLADIAGSKASVKIDAGVGTVSFDQTSIATVAAVTGDVSISVKKLEPTATGRPVYDFTVTAGGKTVSDFGGGTVEVNLPYTPSANEDIHAIVIYYVSDSGQTVVVPNSVYDQATGKVTFNVKHFSNYSIGYNKLSFGDTGSSFAQDYITYLAAREIIGGVGANKFAPTDKMTRADITVILARMAEADLSSYAVSSFVDVDSSAYYSKSIEWAVDQGIVGGIGKGLFNPKAFVTREQLVTMIARYATFKKFALPQSVGPVTFVDQSKIPSYALSSVVAVQQAGIVGGKTLSNQSGLFFAPKDNATRAEAAKVLAILMQAMIK